MNNDTSEKKDSILKILAIAGFIGIIVLIAWASIQLVSVVPSAFSSLASLAESVNQPNNPSTEVETLLVTSNTQLANTGEVVNIDWNTVRANGSYVFSYECVDGVTVDLINSSGVQSITCGNNYNIGNVDSTAITINSQQDRYADITYSISFLGTNDTRPRAAGSATLTVLNKSINNDLAVDDTDVEDEDDNSDVEVPPTETPEPTTPDSPATQPTPEPEYVQEYTYAIPTSNPNGFTDLATRYLFVGEIVKNKFVPGAIRQGDQGAVQFEVKNFGTKTSQKWSFSVSLPGGGTYKSKSQRPLKPNERAILTVGFSGTDVSSHNFEVAVDVTNDSNRSNNKFAHRVKFFD